MCLPFSPILPFQNFGGIDFHFLALKLSNIVLETRFMLQTSIYQGCRYHTSKLQLPINKLTNFICYRILSLIVCVVVGCLPFESLSWPCLVLALHTSTNCPGDCARPLGGAGFPVAGAPGLCDSSQQCDSIDCIAGIGHLVRLVCPASYYTPYDSDPGPDIRSMHAGCCLCVPDHLDRHGHGHLGRLPDLYSIPAGMNSADSGPVLSRH